MKAKETVLELYRLDVMRDAEKVKQLLHSNAVLEWNGSTGFVTLSGDEIVSFSNVLHQNYVQITNEITHVVEEENKVAVRYTSRGRTIENPNEEMEIAHFMVIWELLDGKLYKGYQISQF